MNWFSALDVYGQTFCWMACRQNESKGKKWMVAWDKRFFIIRRVFDHRSSFHRPKLVNFYGGPIYSLPCKLECLFLAGISHPSLVFMGKVWSSPKWCHDAQDDWVSYPLFSTRMETFASMKHTSLLYQSVTYYMKFSYQQP
jgi:hypothetical protein